MRGTRQRRLWCGVTKRALELFEADEAAIPRGYDGFLYRPRRSEGVPADSGIVGVVVLAGDVVDHNGGGFAHTEAVGDSARKVDGVAGQGREFADLMFAVGRRADAEVESDVEDGSGGAVEQFGVVVGRSLEVHATENIRVRGGVEAFAEVTLEALLVEDGALNGLDEVAAIVVEDGELHDIAAGQFGLSELNSAVDGARGDNSGLDHGVAS